MRRDTVSLTVLNVTDVALTGELNALSRFNLSNRCLLNFPLRLVNGYATIYFEIWVSGFRTAIVSIVRIAVILKILSPSHRFP